MVKGVIEASRLSSAVIIPATSPARMRHSSMTRLDKILKRSLNIGGVDYVITLTPEVLKLTRKGRRLGVELKWADITSG